MKNYLESEIPKTGDPMPLLGYIGLIAASAGGVLGLLAAGRRRRRS